MRMEYLKILKGKSGGELFLLGNAAIARGALESGINVYTYYPGTPSSEVGEIFTILFKEAGLNWVESSVNEKIAIEVAGAAYARGAKAMVGMKNVGLNVASDAFFALATTHPKNKNSAIVVLVADDPQQYSSAVEMDSRYYLKLLKIPALEPSNPQECLDYTKSAFEISRELKIPVILRLVTMVAHARSNVKLGEIIQPEIDESFDLSPEVNVASRLYFLDLKQDQIYNRMNRALIISENSSLNRVEFENESNNFNLGIITSGVSYSYVIEALEFFNIKAPILKLGFINPLPERRIVAFLKQFKKVFVVEENDAYIETEVLAIAQKNCVQTKILGKDPFSYSKESSLLNFVGELNPTEIALALMKITNLTPKINLNQIKDKRYETVRRRPVLCPGCPYGTIGYALKKAVKKLKSDLGKEIYFYQDIGCYTLLSFPPYSFANVKYCMGSSIALAQGVAHTDDSLNIAIIGDGTFFHSGIPALLNGIHNKAPILVLILDNGWIGMTGQQHHPGSDPRYYQEGSFKKQIDLGKFLQGTGANISIIKHQKRIEGKYSDRLSDLIYEKGHSVLEKRDIHVIVIEDECTQKYIQRNTLEVRYIDGGQCTNCGICYTQFYCPALNEKDDRAQINSNECLGCGICEEICPNNAILGGDNNEY
ncbi:MAG: indolepyruvate ferredoxin oxidoreductase subunit alpha [Candidatus Lokiarchaeota archaeon]|nr:indolepyruvate ferredoxin oxidoreductase subunit alpha [Candidatus Lokiarchaeota archaeon]